MFFIYSLSTTHFWCRTISDHVTLFLEVQYVARSDVMMVWFAL